VTPLRVDRVKHNEDIDNKIFELLDAADFVIADLTYARPSVYYEAGYAAGKSKSVIYIAKRDHFKAHDDDPYGNFRVHFDLQMKNIISWTNPDRIFSDKLIERVRLILRPLERANRQNLELETERSEFNRLPMYERLRILQKTCIDQLHTQ
jgi:nucleoside 2-deoxyribosyltransferase